MHHSRGSLGSNRFLNYRSCLGIQAISLTFSLIWKSMRSGIRFLRKIL